MRMTICELNKNIGLIWREGKVWLPGVGDGRTENPVQQYPGQIPCYRNWRPRIRHGRMCQEEEPFERAVGEAL